MDKERITSKLEMKIKNLENENGKLHLQVKNLNETAERFMSIFANANDQISYISPDGTILDVNNKVEEIFGYTREEVIGKNVIEIELFSPEDFERIKQHVFENFSNVSPSMREIKAFRKDSSTVFIEANSRVIKKQNKIVGILCIIRDISKRKIAEKELEKHRLHLEELVKERTEELINSNRKLKREIEERHQAQKNLRESEEKFKAIFENANDIICYTDTTGKVVNINSKVKEIFGYNPNDAIGSVVTDWGFLNPKDVKRNFSVCQNVRAGRPGGMIEIEVSLKDRPVSFIEVNSKLLEKGGNVQGVLHIIRDISKRKQAEKALRKHSDHLDELVKERTINLEETNTALKVLLKKREEDKEELGQKVLANVKELILPYLDKLKKRNLRERQETLVKIIESNMKDIISPFSYQLCSTLYSLTPAELQTADLVKLGKTTKEIAEALNSSIRAIEFHRNNVRNKLGLKNKKTNLRSHLMSLK